MKKCYLIKMTPINFSKPPVISSPEFFVTCKNLSELEDKLKTLKSKYNLIPFTAYYMVYEHNSNGVKTETFQLKKAREEYFSEDKLNSLFLIREFLKSHFSLLKKTLKDSNQEHFSTYIKSKIDKIKNEMILNDIEIFLYS